MLENHPAAHSDIILAKIQKTFACKQPSKYIHYGQAICLGIIWVIIVTGRIKPHVVLPGPTSGCFYLFFFLKWHESIQQWLRDGSTMLLEGGHGPPRGEETSIRGSLVTWQLVLSPSITVPPTADYNVRQQKG